MEIVISAHKSVAELGVIGRAEDMHPIMDAERDATLAYLDQVTRQMGGRRGEAAKATATGGLIYAHTRHATSRAGDPCPHDHVLLANLVEMKDEQGGWKAADTALWREHLHAATMVGRVAAARVAVELGYGIEADPGPSGRLGHWRIAGVPDEVMELHSKRAAEIEAECQRRGERSYQARGVAARTTRKAKGHEAEGELVGRWRAELAAAGWPVERLAASVDAARRTGKWPSRSRLKDARAVHLRGALADDGDLARRKVFSRRHLVVALAPHLLRPGPRGARARWSTGPWPTPRSVPLVGVAGRAGAVHSLASVLARESAIAESLARQLARTDAPARAREPVEAAIARAEAELAVPRCRTSSAPRSSASAPRDGGPSWSWGWPGPGKTTMLRAVAEAFERAGHQVLGTATSGQAARNLGHEAEIGESRTLASLIWRLDHGQLALNEQDCGRPGRGGHDRRPRPGAPDRLRRGGRGQVGADRRPPPARAGRPGRGLGALVARHPGAVHYLAENRRQHDPEERQALEALRDGDVAEAVTLVRRAAAASTPCPAGTTPYRRRSRPGRPTSLPATRQGCTPGGGPTWPSSTSRPGPGWKPPAGFRPRAGLPGRGRLPGRRPRRHPGPRAGRHPGHLAAGHSRSRRAGERFARPAHRRRPPGPP